MKYIVSYGGHGKTRKDVKEHDILNLKIGEHKRSMVKGDRT